tara:strand:- start:590 stop:733 length:144 start_codon:yes stop_codon:yes gene_type:complete
MEWWCEKKMPPGANEFLIAIVVTNSGRPLAGIGSLSVNEIEGEDGQR